VAQPDPDPEIEVDVTLLPHWARVAFAARCARRVHPLFNRCWSRAAARRTDAIRLAIELAEQSSAAGKAVEGLKSATIDAVATAGAALSPVYGFESKEPTPDDADSATIASFVANAAGKAADAAQATSSVSSGLAFEAYGFAQDAATNASAVGILIDIEQDFARLYRAVIRGRWKDKTPVPSTVFDGP
jgi:hypothetical protein